MNAGRVVSLQTCPAAGARMRSHRSVRAVTGRGLEGDRYFLTTGTYSGKPGPGRQVTLVESEAVEALARDCDLRMRLPDTRRNIGTRGVALNHLVGRTFRVGGAILRGVRLCEPCSHLESLTRKGVLAGLVHRGGLRAEILRSGKIRVGDPITVRG